MLKKIIYILICITIISCTNENYSDLIETDTTLNLKFNAYETATNNDARIGLEWALSQIGAKKTNILFNGIIQNETIFTIDYEQLGFNENAKIQLEKLHQKIKESQEYKQNNNIDLGRYVTLIIGASEHYFKITGISKNLNDIIEKYTLNSERGYINDSSVSLKDRIIAFSQQTNLNQLFVSSEVEPINGEILEFETIEIMKNGQLKFGLFDAFGERKNVANSQHTNAGKPAKCMWCHESKLFSVFSVQNDIKGFLPYSQFKDSLSFFSNELNEKQQQLINGINFSNTQDHTKMELLYISFLEPSVGTLSLEWDLPFTEVQNRLSALQTHQHEEFPFLGDLYHRNDVEQFAPFVSLQVSTSVREESEIEVNHID